MDATPKLNLPYIHPSQAQANVTHNEALGTLDVLVHLTVLSRDASVAPPQPSDGDCHIVGPDATAEWSGQSGNIAAWLDGGWTFHVPSEGWQAWSTGDAAVLIHLSGHWVLRDKPAPAPSMLGLNAGADAQTRLAVSSAGSLFTHEGGSHRMTINKETPADTASLLFKDAWRGCAELGLSGTDNFSIKVSADGIRFVEALQIDRTTGAVTMPRAAVPINSALNLLLDSGRMGGGSSAQIVGGFVMPSYLALANGTTAVGLAKFINNNTDYGGNGGVLHASVRALIEMIRDVSCRRNNAEFWIVQATQGSGVAGSIAQGGVTYYQSMGIAQRLRPASLTFHAYLKAVDERILVGPPASGVVVKNGVDQNGPACVAPAEGWVSITIRETIDPRFLAGAAQTPFTLFCKAAGHRWQIACPALIAGSMPIDDNIGIVCALNGWGA